MNYFGLYTAVDSHLVSETGIQRRYKKDFLVFVQPFWGAVQRISSKRKLAFFLQNMTFIFCGS